MALVAYSDSGDDSDREAHNIEEATDAKQIAGIKRKLPSSKAQGEQLPPLPDSFFNLYAAPVRTSTVDDPALHSGRQRSTPHITGNWPTHVYIEWIPSNAESEALASVISSVTRSSNREEEADVHSLLMTDLGVQLPLHVSLSRSLNLEFSQKLPFATALRSAVEGAELKTFDVAPSGLAWVSNLEGSRSFLVLRLARPNEDGLNRLLSACNKIASSFCQPPLYADQDETAQVTKPKRTKRSHSTRPGSLSKAPKCESRFTVDATDKFHVSIAWSLGSRSDDLNAQLSVKVRDLRIPIECIKFKIGSVIDTIGLEKQFSGSDTSYLGAL